MSLHARIHVGAGDVIGEKVLTDDHTSYKRPYQCDLCHKSYSTAKHRWGHVSTTHRCVLLFLYFCLTVLHVFEIKIKKI